MLLDAVLLIVLIAWFLGISFGAALHGLLQFIGVVIVIGIIIVVINAFLETSQVQTPVVQTVKKPVQQYQRPIKKKPSKHGGIFLWACFFIVSYCITLIILMIFSDIIKTPLTALINTEWLPSWAATLVSTVLGFAIPTIPFDIFLIYRTIKKHAGKKHRRIS